MIIQLSINAILSACVLWWWSLKGICAIPNERSSHRIPTPTGAGIFLVGIFLLSQVIAYIQEFEFSTEYIFFLIGIFLLALVGFIDDWKELHYKTRLISHVIAVVIVLIHQPFSGVENIWWLLIGVGLINATNFLDGLNGFLTSQWLLTIGFLLAGFFSSTNPLWVLWGIFAVFLVFNFPKAKVFMGDSGSTILGYTYFYIILQMALKYGHQFPAYLLPYDILLVFALLPMAFAWVDITLTLGYRLIKKHSLVLSFKDYGFHKLAQTFNGHTITTFFYLVLNTIMTIAASYIFLHHDALLWVIFMYILMQLSISYVVFFRLRAT